MDKVVADPKLRKTASTIMDEASAIGNAELAEKYGEGNFIPLGEAEKTAMMNWCEGVGRFSPSTLVDFLKGQQMEVRYLFQEPIIRGDRLGVPCPNMKTVVAKIQKLADGKVSPRGKNITLKAAREVSMDRIPFESLNLNAQAINM